MKHFLFCLLWIASVSVGSANTVRDVRQFADAGIGNDSMFFSVKSLCNITVEFLPGKKAKAMLVGKSHNGTITKNRNSKDYLDFNENGAILFTFLFDDGKLFILNQQYQFGCESAKIIELSHYSEESRIKDDFDAYEKFNSELWANTGAVNDKAFYLGEMKFYDASAYILRKVVAKSPKRAVAWLNLADSLWELGEQASAKKAYSEYVTLMTDQKKDLNKIPKRVHDRTNAK